MVNAAVRERELTKERGKKLTVGLDMGWQKRGNCYCYISLSGHSCMIGAESGKVLAVQVMSSTCTSCQRKGTDCGKPTCKRNHDGSAKSMVAAAALLMLDGPTLKEANVVVEVVAGDADSSTSAAIKNTYGDKIFKALDLTHAKKNFKNHLFSLQKQHKRLTKQAILYLTATVGTVLNQNKGNAEKLAEALRNIPEHVFNRHDKCDETWCRYKSDPNNYKSRYLSKSLGEYGCDLHSAICGAIEKLANKAEELAGGSTQPNESFNYQVCSKTPKYKHYSGTESLTYRV